MATKKTDDTKKVVKATPADAVAKVEAVKKAEAAKAVKAPAEEKKAAAKPVAKKPAAAKTTTTKAAATKTTAAKAEEKKPAAKKPAAKKPAAKAVEKVYVEYGNGQLDVAELVAKAKDAIGKKSVKELNVYYQPETGMVYYTADGETGSYSL